MTYYLNKYSEQEYGVAKYPDVVFNFTNTNESFGFEYLKEKHAMDFNLSYCDDEDLVVTTTSLERPFKISQKKGKSSLNFVPRSLPSIPSKSHLPVTNYDLSTASTPSPLGTSLSSTNFVPTSADRTIFSSPDFVPTSPDRSILSSPESIMSSPPRSIISLPDSVNTSPTKRQLGYSAKSRRRAGNPTALHFRKWTPQMKDAIDDLLSRYVEDESKVDKVLKEYTKQVRHSAESEGVNTRLFFTSSRFIHLYERDFNRKIEEAQSLSTSVVDVNALQSSLHEKGVIASGSIDLNCRPEVKDEPDWPNPHNIPVISLIENVVDRKLGQCDSSKPKPKRVRKPKHNLSGNNQGRNCLHCGQPKSRMQGINNLHHTHIKKGDPGIFYCPHKMNQLYGSPLDMVFSQFRESQFWPLAVRDAQKSKEESEERKRKAAEKREEEGWKKSGPDCKKSK